MPGIDTKPIHIPLEAKGWHVERGWRRLEDLCKGVFDCPHTTPTITNSGPYVVRSQDIRSGILRLSEAGHVAQETYEERIARAEPSYGDLLYSREGTYFGIAAEVPPGIKVCLGQRMVLIRPNAAHLNSRFLRYWLNSPTMVRHIEGFRDGTVAERLNMPVIRGLPVPVFRGEAQYAIASILGALDDKIELNRRMNETLETMARATFKDWFIDFGPTRAKLEGRSPYLAPEIWVLFPDRLDDEGKPRGWEIGTLDGCANLNPESWSRGIYPSFIKYVDLSGTKWGTIENVEPHSREDAPSRAQRVLRPGDTIVGMVRPGNGSYAYVSEDGLTGSTGFAALRPVHRDTREYVYLAATSRENIDRLTHLADGAAYPAVRPEVIMATEAAIVGGPLMKAFSLTTGPLIKRMETNKREARTLASTRDLLLPKLMSGEVQMKVAEKVVEAAL